VTDFKHSLDEAERAFMAAMSVPPQRPSWDDYFLNIADAVAQRADCTRRRVGAVVVKKNRIVSTGYNGAAAGGPSCLGGECPRGLDLHAPSTPDYSNCIAVHAEANALLYADRDKCEGATIYVTDAPCIECTKLIYGAGISHVVVKP
jgi:dCMP deaminase